MPSWALQLGWLRPEYKFWAHRPMHEALIAGEFDSELSELMGHFDPAESRLKPHSEVCGHATLPREAAAVGAPFRASSSSASIVLLQGATLGCSHFG